MRKYLDHIKTKEPHERRQHAMQIAGIITAAVFVVWITTLGLRLGSSAPNVAQDNSNQTSLGAAAAANEYQPNQLIVASTTGY